MKAILCAIILMATFSVASGMINTDSAYACVQDNAPFPTSIQKNWQVYDKAAGYHKEDNSMKITAEDTGTKGRNNSGSKKTKTKKKPEYDENELAKQKLECEQEIEKIKNKVDMLILDVRENGRELDKLKDEREERLTLGENFENEYNQKSTKYKEDREKLGNAIRHAKKIKSEMEDLQRQLTESEKCESFAELLELTKNEENHRKLIDGVCEIIQQKTKEELLELFSSCEFFCQEVIRTAQDNHYDRMGIENSAPIIEEKVSSSDEEEEEVEEIQNEEEEEEEFSDNNLKEGEETKAGEKSTVVDAEGVESVDEEEI